MKIPPFIEVRNNTLCKKRYYLFEPELSLEFLNGSELKIRREEKAVRVLVNQGTSLLEIAGARRKEIVTDRSIFFNFMDNEIFLDNFEARADEELFNPTGLCFVSSIMKKTFEEAMRHAGDEELLFLSGETGTGKELMAKNIHYNSKRKHNPFVVIDAGSLDGDRVDCELFGTVRGAYTNSEEQVKGAFLSAGKGTLVIDEIGEIPLDIQSKLLRAIEYGEVKPVGSDRVRKHNARIIVLSNNSLEALLKEKKIREDLFYRIERYRTEIPALRLRKEDLVPLAGFFTDNAYTFTGRALSLLQDHNWPGNVRELRNCLDRAMLCCRNRTIDHGDLVIKEIWAAKTENRAGKDTEYIRVERELIKAILDRNDKNVSKSSRDLGIARGTLISRIKKYNIVH